MNIEPGMCFHLTATKNLSKHLYIVLTSPEGDPPRVALANMTKDNIPDKTVVIEVGEHPFVNTTSYIYYAEATVITVRQIENICAEDPRTRHKVDCSPQLLERVRKGIYESEFTRPSVQRFCKGKF